MSTSHSVWEVHEWGENNLCSRVHWVAIEIYFQAEMSLILKFNRDCIRDYFASSQWCALSHLIILQCFINYRMDVHLCSLWRAGALWCVCALSEMWWQQLTVRVDAILRRLLNECVIADQLQTQLHCLLHGFLPNK